MIGKHAPLFSARLATTFKTAHSFYKNHKNNINDNQNKNRATPFLLLRAFIF
jgi:hypothetical protein